MSLAQALEIDSLLIGEYRVLLRVFHFLTRCSRSLDARTSYRYASSMIAKELTGP